MKTLEFKWADGRTDSIELNTYPRGPLAEGDKRTWSGFLPSTITVDGLTRTEETTNEVGETVEGRAYPETRLFSAEGLVSVKLVEDKTTAGVGRVGKDGRAAKAVA